MGLCFGTRIKTERALQNGEIETGNNMNGSGTNVSSNEVASSLLREGEIMQSPKLRRFSFSDLKVATGDFNPNSLLGEGAFGCVYKGWIDKHSFTPAKPETGMAIAVKTLNPKGTQGQQEWLAEIMYLGQLRHPNLVELIGYCIENYYRLLVYEFMPNRSLENHLFGGTSDFQPLSWNLRVKVALGAAKGLAFLHKKAHVVHRDFKTSDILLDSSFNAKLSDFGLAKDGPTSGRSHVTTRVVGTYGYAAPEYIGTGHVSPKSDVYSFGVVLLEVLTGKRAIDYSRPAGEQNLVEWAKPYLNNKRRVFLLMDSRIADQFSPKSVIQATKLAVRCLSTEPKLRPDMEAVAKELEEISQIIDNETSTAPRS